MKQWLNYITEKIELTASISADWTLALSMFKAQTGRGLDLQPSDIFKAVVFEAFQGDKEGQENAIERWEVMQENMGRDKLQPYLLTLADMLHPAAPLKGDELTVTHNFTKYLVKTGGITQFSSELLPLSLEAYRVVTGEPPYYSGDQARDINTHIQRLNCNVEGVLKPKRAWLPVAMRMVMLHGGNGGKLNMMLKRLERLAAFLRVSPLKPTQKVERMRAALKQLNDLGQAGPGN